MYVPTGYIATNDVLRAYAQSGKVPTLHRVEQYGRKLVFYFDYVRFTILFPLSNVKMVAIIFIIIIFHVCILEGVP